MRQLAISELGAPPEPLEYEWFADADDRERHAFPAVDGFRHTICDLRLRWTVRWSHDGNSECLGCRQELRERMRSMPPRVAAESESEARAAWGDR